MNPAEIAETPGSSTVRARVEARLEEANRADGAPETVRVEWRGQPANFKVVTVPLEDLLYNPETHRIRAQRSHDPVFDAKLAEDPWSKESQDYLHRLLQCKPDNPDATDPDFEKLKEDLQEYGQKDAGIITPSGILVNGNTRCAALRDLNRNVFRAAVLPATATWADIAAVELELQLRKDRRRDYSYINRLIAVHEQTSAGRTPQELGKDFRTTPKMIERDLWVYEFISDAIERSRGELGGGGTTSLRLMDFEGHQETLSELHRSYHKATDTGKAEALRENRLLAIVLGTAKTKVRYVGHDFHNAYLVPKLGEEFAQSGKPVDEAFSLPGLDLGEDLPLLGDEPDTLRARAFTDRVLRARARQAAASQLTAEEASEARTVLEQVKEAVEQGVHEAEWVDRRAKRKSAAAKTLQEAAKLVSESTQQASQARSQDLMEHRALDESLLELATALKKLSRVASRGVEEPGPGLSWLQDAVADL
ncbi:hypothetical protein ACIRPH_02500 [Nocardiopsis sp. NPDC101807]|uniref:hypothetical protein n=1 Tax=Nocardiopsis sp. NPDC101807 TaxID=3364339 RepID=UPI003820F61F